ncbi:hypothetical protein PP175_00305 [Aneurinibacillus sp. Ricciae_BoGa-3]|uniref:hypothetical protein n=1 Tax=Aneurinibacillus sp. Ricciae_BoGa-3 TaxID=3022697 RepID=UPI00233FB8DD|nr:hypothetical protein [Aneurinibacillus sp. Ricciae_BoGa-3]WCK54561.1 hypothetical protein PP175_00305 [Aneurinibacillus sp. Ricciae_BoGa-3]
MNAIESTLQKINQNRNLVRIEYGVNSYVDGYITYSDRDFIYLKEDSESKYPERENIFPMSSINRIILLNTDDDKKNTQKPGFL